MLIWVKPLPWRSAVIAAGETISSASPMMMMSSAAALPNPRRSALR
jgi:hypothetical protein